MFHHLERMQLRFEEALKKRSRISRLDALGVKVAQLFSRGPRMDRAYWRVMRIRPTGLRPWKSGSGGVMASNVSLRPVPGYPDRPLSSGTASVLCQAPRGRVATKAREGNRTTAPLLLQRYADLPPPPVVRNPDEEGKYNSSEDVSVEAQTQEMKKLLFGRRRTPISSEFRRMSKVRDQEAKELAKVQKQQEAAAIRRQKQMAEEMQTESDEEMDEGLAKKRLYSDMEASLEFVRLKTSGLSHVSLSQRGMELLCSLIFLL